MEQFSVAKLRIPQEIATFLRNSENERETGVEPATSSLGSLHSTTELLPQLKGRDSLSGSANFQACFSDVYKNRRASYEIRKSLNRGGHQFFFGYGIRSLNRETVGYRSGQTGQTVNLLAMPSKVRILPLPPFLTLPPKNNRCDS